MDKNREKKALNLRSTNFFFVLVAVIVAVALFVADAMVTRGFRQSEQANERYLAARIPAIDLEIASDYLTDRVRCFVVTGDRQYMDDFFEEVQVTRRRDNALSELEELLESNSSDAYEHLADALSDSNELLQREYHAMRLMQQALSLRDVPKAVASIELSAEEMALSAEQQQAAAQALVFDQDYMRAKERIKENVRLCTTQLIDTASQSVETASTKMTRLLTTQTALTVLLLLVVLVTVYFISTQVRKPLTRMVKLMQAQESVPPAGAQELQYVTRTYNTILEENKQKQRKLAYDATHDALTGLYNRSAYEMFLSEADKAHIGLVLVDVDEFKHVNDTYGHDVGDKVLRKVAEMLKHSFRSADTICRIGGDEFVVIMTRANSTMGPVVVEKMQHANSVLKQPKDGLPPVSLSVGIAFSDRENPQGDLFKDADTALYRVKEGGRCGAAVY